MHWSNDIIAIINSNKPFYTNTKKTLNLKLLLLRLKNSSLSSLDYSFTKSTIKMAYPVWPLNDARVNYARVNNAHINHARINDARINHARVNDARVNGTPVNDTPVNDTPVNDTPVNETHVKPRFYIKHYLYVTVRQ